MFYITLFIGMLHSTHFHYMQVRTFIISVSVIFISYLIVFMQDALRCNA